MRVRSVDVRAVLVPLILVELAVFYILIRNSSWVFDDNLNLVLAGQEGFTWHWLNFSLFEHWALGLRALIALQHLVFFLDYRWALLAFLGLLGASIYLFQRVLALIVRTQWITVVLAAWFGLSILWVEPLQWWIVGAEQLPATFFELVCLYGFLRYYADQEARWIGVSAGALVAALLFYQHPAYMLLYLLLIRVLLMNVDLRARHVLADLWSERWVWAVYVTIVAVWGVGYLHFGHFGGFEGHRAVSVGNYIAYFRILWLQTLVPAIAGTTIPAAGLDSLQVAFVAISQVAVVAAVVVSLRRRRSAWRAWAFLGIILLLTGLLVAHQRVPGFGPGIANSRRYLIDFSWIVPLALCAAFLRDDTLRPAVPEHPSRVALPKTTPLALGVLAASLAYAGAAVASAAQVESKWPGVQGREWETHVRRGIAALERSGVRPVVADNATPFEIMQEFVAPLDRLSRVLPMYVGPIQVDGPFDAPLVQISNNGTVHKAGFNPVAGEGDVASLVGSHQVSFGAGARELREGDKVCVIADGVPVGVERVLPVAPDQLPGPYYIQLRYKVWQPVNLSVSANDGHGYPDVPYYGIQLAPNVGASIGWVGPTMPHGVVVSVPPLTTVCLRNLEIGVLRDAG